MTPFLALAIFAAPAEGGGSPLPIFLIQIGAIFAIFYFLLIRPQQRQRRAHEERIRAVKKGDRIVTAGGIVGEVVHIKEGVKDGQKVTTLEDWITIKSAESRLIVERQRIAKVIEPTVEKSA